jgi:CBS domain-containing protein
MVVGSVMDDAPLTCTPETEMDEVRRMMLGRHARYMPVMSNRTLMGVISFYDVAKAVVDTQDFENRMLKAYIRDWPSEDSADPAGEKAEQAAHAAHAGHSN